MYSRPIKNWTRRAWRPLVRNQRVQTDQGAAEARKPPPIFFSDPFIQELMRPTEECTTVRSNRRVRVALKPPYLVPLPSPMHFSDQRQNTLPEFAANVAPGRKHCARELAR